jgi:uncharacterized protein GlcG (DUF336 family)
VRKHRQAAAGQGYGVSTSLPSVEQRVVTAAAVVTALQAAVAHAEGLGIRVNVAVAEPSGVLCGLLRMPGAFVHSVDIAIDKARTAAGFGFPTSGWAAVVGDDELLRLGLAQRPGLVMFGGGLPIVEAGRCIGGIGVSGGSAEQDEQCAAAGLRAIGLG